MTETIQLDDTDDQDVAQLTNPEDSDLALSALIEPTPKSQVFLSSNDPTSEPGSELPAPMEPGLDLNTVGSSTKRSADDESEHEFNKRVKASHHPSIPTPITIPPSHLSHPYLLDTPTSQTSRLMGGDWPTNSPMDDLITTPFQCGLRATPAFPVEAIGTLQQASADMLQALVRKDAVDREKQLMVAVGTMRTCLDIHFIPHLEAWRHEAEGDQKGSQVLSFKGKGKQSSIITSGPPPGTPTGPRDLEAASDSVRDTLQNQLAIARATVQRQEQIIKDKDNQLARTREENNRLTTHLAKAKVQASVSNKPAKPVLPPKPDLSNAVTALNKVIDDQNGKIDRQRKYIAILEGRNAKLQKEVAPLPSKPVVNKVDPQVAALKKTIKEQAGRIDRQKGQLSLLERQNATLKKQTNVQPSQGRSRKKDQNVVGQRENGAGVQGGGQRDVKPTLGDRIGHIGGQQPQRQIPPHLDGRGDEAGSIATNDVDPAFLKSVESLIASMSNASGRNEHSAEPDTAATAGLFIEVSPRSRTGSNRIAVNGRSLWDRIGRQGAEAEGAMGQERKEIKQEEGREEGGISACSGEPEQDISKLDDGWSPSHPDGDGWGDPTLDQDGEGHVVPEDKVNAHIVPGEGVGNEDQQKDDQWGNEDGEHWDPYRAQSVRAEPGPSSTGW